MNEVDTAGALHPVDQAILEGRVAPSAKANYMRLFGLDPEGTRSALATLPKSVPVGEVGGAAPPNGRRRSEPYPSAWLANHRPPDTGPGSITEAND